MDTLSRSIQLSLPRVQRRLAEAKPQRIIGIICPKYGAVTFAGGSTRLEDGHKVAECEIER